MAGNGEDMNCRTRHCDCCRCRVQDKIRRRSPTRPEPPSIQFIGQVVRGIASEHFQKTREPTDRAWAILGGASEIFPAIGPLAMVIPLVKHGTASALRKHIDASRSPGDGGRMPLRMPVYGGKRCHDTQILPGV